MDILVSFNNTYQSPGFPALGLMDPVTMAMRIVELPPHVPQTGVLGLAVSAKYVFLGIQYAFDATKSYRVPPEVGLEYSEDGVLASLHPCSLVIVDRYNMAIVHQHEFELVKDVHSFLLSRDEHTLYVVSTGTDEVIEVLLEEGKVASERVYWRPATATDRSDNHHLNSILAWHGDMLVSGFGQRAIADNWNSATNGFIYNITTQQYIVQGLLQPHSLAVIDGRLAYCESNQKRVRFTDTHGSAQEQMYDMGGYSRGLCEIDGHVFVGTSARRSRSRSTGKLVEKVDGVDLGCTITNISRDGNFNTIDLAAVAHEIYEMIPIGNTTCWPFKPHMDYEARFQLAWRNQVSLAIREMHEHAVLNVPLLVADEMILGIQPNQMPGVTIHSFIEKDGVYWGPPESDEAAVAALLDAERIHKQFILAIAWPAFWWLDIFPAFRTHISDTYETLYMNDRVNIFSTK